MQEIIKKYLVIRFDSIIEGINFMLTYDYPSSFIVGDVIYDKNGNSILLDDFVEINVLDIRNVITDNSLFIESEMCYDGDNLFLQKYIF